MIKTNRRLPRFLALALLAGAPTLRADDASAAHGVQFPFIIYEDKGSTNNHYVPSGWMGNAGGIQAEDGCTNRPHCGATCLRFAYTAPAQWGGVVWQDPINDWGDVPGGWNLTGARKLSFWARGDQGGEIVSFKFGILGPDKKYSDSASGESTDLKLTRDWQVYTIDLTGKDLTRVKTGFVWTLMGQGHPVVFYLDDIRFE
jgi:hypothetical protein